MFLEISRSYGVLLEDQGITLRGLFIIDPQGVIRQITINCAERGFLLVRVRDEIKMTIQAY